MDGSIRREKTLSLMVMGNGAILMMTGQVLATCQSAFSENGDMMIMLYCQINKVLS